MKGLFGLCRKMSPAPNNVGHLLMWPELVQGHSHLLLLNDHFKSLLNKVTMATVTMETVVQPH